MDWESSYIYIIRVTRTSVRQLWRFYWQKMTLETFLLEHSDGTLDIMDESYGFRLTMLSGFLNLQDHILEFKLEIYYTGEIRYLLKE